MRRVSLAERSHEVLDQETAGSRYAASARSYPSRLPAEYLGHLMVKHVPEAGTFRFYQRLLYHANALVD